MRLPITYLLLGLLLTLTACDKGELLENKAPDTRISVSEINLTGEDRLRSEVTLHWFGADEDGWITGYELSLDGTNWSPVTKQDSTFSFELTLGSDTTDIDFYVRAVDNDDAVDPTPAYLRVPIRNSPPTAIFDTLQTLPDTAYIALTLFLDVDDLDGADNLDSIYIKVNNGDWYGLSSDVSIVTLVPSDPTATGPVNSKVYKNATANLLAAEIEGLVPGADNVFYIRATDIAGADSPIDTSKTVYFERKTSDLLVIDANSGGTSPTPEEVIMPALAASFPTVDVIDLRSNNGAKVPRLWMPTFGFTLLAYDRVFWYGDASDITIDLLESAAGAIQAYLNAGGKILINTSFPSTYTNESVIQEFTPVDSISTVPGTVRLPTDSLVVPHPVTGAGYDTLEASIFVGRATPFYVKSTAEVIYTANLFTSGGWTGPETVAARLTNGAGNTNVVLISVQLHQINGRPAALEGFLNEVLVNEFNW